MTRDQLEHAIRAVADLTGETKLIIIGSQAILGQFPDLPPELLVSQEIDVYTPDRPEMSEFITGACGLDTPFERTHGFQIDGVTPTTATVPGGWENRLVPVCNENTNGATGWCLEVHDIAVAKYFANREKDRRYTTDLWRHGMLDDATIRERMRIAPVTKAKRSRALVTRFHAENGYPGETGSGDFRHVAGLADGSSSDGSIYFQPYHRQRAPLVSEPTAPAVEVATIVRTGTTMSGKLAQSR